MTLGNIEYAKERGRPPRSLLKFVNTVPHWSALHHTSTHMAPPWITFCPVLAGCLRHFRTALSDSLACVTWIFPVCAMTHLHVFYDSLTCVPWCICVCAFDSIGCAPWHRDSLARVPWFHHVCAMTHLYVCHVMICVPWAIKHCEDTPTNTTANLVRGCVFTMLCRSMTRIQVRVCAFDSSGCATWLWMYMPWLLHMCTMTHSYVCHTHSYVCRDSLICVPSRIRVCVFDSLGSTVRDVTGTGLFSSLESVLQYPGLRD